MHEDLPMKLTPLALAGALALTAAGASLAQPAAPAAPSRSDDAPSWRRPDPGQMAARRAERLRAVLQLRADQEPALRAFIAATTPSPEQMRQRRAERAEVRDLTTPQRLDRMQARLGERQAQFTRKAEAVRRFYAQLNPGQQRAFDALHEGRGGGARHAMRHGGGSFK